MMAANEDQGGRTWPNDMYYHHHPNKAWQATDQSRTSQQMAANEGKSGIIPLRKIWYSNNDNIWKTQMQEELGLTICTTITIPTKHLLCKL